jgi:hypothetical protein
VLKTPIFSGKILVKKIRINIFTIITLAPGLILPPMPSLSKLAALALKVQKGGETQLF